MMAENETYTGNTVSDTAFLILTDAVRMLEKYRNDGDEEKFMEYAPEVFGICAEYFRTFDRS